MAGIGMVFGLVGSAVSAMGAMAQAQGQAEAQRAQAAAMDANAAAQRKRAMEERAAGSINAEREWVKAQRLMSDQQARFASSGGGLGGTASTVIGNTAVRGRQNSNLVVWDSEQKGRGYEDQAAITAYSADRLREAADRTASTGGIAAIGGLLSGVSRVGGSTNIDLGPSSYSNLYYGPTVG